MLIIFMHTLYEPCPSTAQLLSTEMNTRWFDLNGGRRAVEPWLLLGVS